MSNMLSPHPDTAAFRIGYKLLPNARTKVESGRVNGAGMCLNLALLGGPTY